MPWSLDTASHQKVYFLSRCLNWYQRTFPCRDVAGEIEEYARKSAITTRNGRKPRTPRTAA